MRFTASSIAAAAVIFASVQAAPHGGGHHHGGNSTGEGFGQGSAQESGRGGRGGGRGGRPSGGFSGTGVASFPSATAPAQLPSGTGGLSVPDLSSISFEFPSSAIGAANVKAADDDDEDEDSTKTKKSSKTKTSAAAEASATGSDGDDEAATTSAASAEPTGSDDEESAASTAATPVATGGSGSTNGSSTYAPAASAAASTTFPTAAGESTLSEPMVVTGEFDGGLVRFGRGVECGGQSEGGDSDAVFQVEEGGTLKNVIIGADQGEGVHCMGACTIENVWWEAVCEDALTIKQESGVSYVIGGGAKGASDKVIQHNGGGTVNVQGFYATDFGKLYRSCGNCDTMYERHIIMDGVVADGGSATLVGINTNYGDTATITNSCITNTDPICTEFEGNDTGDEPTEVSTGISASCIYTDADVTTC